MLFFWGGGGACKWKTLQNFRARYWWPQASNLFLAPPHVIDCHCFVMYKIDLCLWQDQQFQRLEAITVFIDYIGLEYDTVQFGTWVPTLRTNWVLLSSGKERRLLCTVFQGMTLYSLANRRLFRWWLLYEVCWVSDDTYKYQSVFSVFYRPTSLRSLFLTPSVC